MPLSDASDFDENDVLAIYENQELDKDKDQHSIQRNEDVYEASDNDERDDGTTARRIDPTIKKQVRNPIPKLNTERLKGPKGIHTIEKYFEGFKFHGHGCEKSDLDRVMKRLEHWGHRLFPKLEFDDFLERVQTLGTKKDLQVFIKKYRQDMINEENDIINQDIINAEEDNEPDEPIDEFDLLIAEQIEKQKQVMNQSSSEANNAAFDKLLTQGNVKVSEPETNTSSELTDEVKERIERNRQQAIQRRLAKLKEREEEAKRKMLEEVKNAQSENSETAHVENDEELESNPQKEQDKNYEA